MLLVALIYLLTSPSNSVAAEQKSEQESHPGISLEVDYAEAVFEFTNKRYNESLNLLNKLIKKSPTHIQALELKALILKNLKNDAASMELYQQLIPLKPEAERVPYHFELGVLFFRAKRYDEATPHLEKAVSANLNVGIGRFFLGIIAMQKKESSKAIHLFKRAIPDVSEEMQVTCHYYVGLLHAQRGYGPGATSEFVSARNMAESVNTPSAREIADAARKALEPYDRTAWFGSLMLQSQYDGNISQISSSVAPEDATGKSGIKANLAFSYGYSSSPVKMFQYMASYRLMANRNFNADAHDYEFAANTLSLFLTMSPLSTTNGGLKLEGSFGFQNRRDPDTNEYSFRPYNSSVELAPYFKHEVDERMPLTLEVSFRPQRFAVDGAGTGKRAGTVIRPKIGLQAATASDLLNPGCSIAYELNNAEGTDQASRTIALDLSNTLNLAGGHSVQLSGNLSLTNYPTRQPQTRSDTTWTLRAGWQKTLKGRWTLSSDVSFTDNTSDIPEVYSYSKPVASVGLSLNL